MNLRVKNISFGYNDEDEVIDNISFDIKPNEILTIVGKSGCGKTTLLNLMAKLLVQKKGSIYLQNSLLENPTTKVSYLTQTPTTLSYRTAFENACLSLELRGELNTKTKKRIEILFQEFDLENSENKFPHELSGGMKQRIGIVQSISVKSLLYLLDEPFTAVDRKNIKIIEDFIWKKKKAQNSSFVIITHDLERAVSISDKVIILDSNPGRVFKEIIFEPEFANTLPSIRNRRPKHSEYVFELVKLFGEL